MPFQMPDPKHLMASSLTSDIYKWQAAFSIEGRVTCWTLLERSVWQRLQAAGLLTCPLSQASDDPMFQGAYAWMKDAMTHAGIVAPAPDLSPWWCWVRRRSNHPWPYIEDAEGLHDPVVLQLAIPFGHVVLSCFDLWHFVLNQWYVPASELDGQDFDRAREGAREGSAVALQLQQRMRNSWSGIFTLDQRAVDLGPFESKSIQGCFWTLRLDDVMAVIEPVTLTSYDPI